MTLIGSPTAGSQHLKTTAAGYPGAAGWIDYSHFVYRMETSAQEAIYDEFEHPSTGRQQPGGTDSGRALASARTWANPGARFFVDATTPGSTRPVFELLL